MAAYPDHAFPNARAFKAEKRRHLRVLKRALDDLRMGCAYFPSGTIHVERIAHEIEELTRELSAKEWGR